MPPKPPLNSGASLLSSSSLLPTSAHASLRPQFLPQTTTRSIKATFKPRPNRFTYHPDRPALSSTTTAALERKAASQTLPLRPGCLAIKKGMSALYDPATGVRTPCTILQLERNEVLALKTRDKHGYWAVQVGAGWKHPSNVTRAMLGHFAAAGTSPKRWVSEFRVRDEGGLVDVGKGIGAGWWREGGWVDVRSTGRGMGFEGGMKKWGFSGQPASHGNSLTHRAMGSSGGSQGSGSRVLPGKKMAGRMGNESVTIQNLRVLKVDEENGIVIVNGCVGGPKGCIVKIQDAIKKPWPVFEMPPFTGVVPTATTTDALVETVEV